MTRLIVRAVSDRAEMVAYLQRHLPDAEFAMDRRRDGFDTLDLALEMAGDDPAVHLEEDILLTRGFRDKLEAEIARQPSTVIQFFSMRKADLTEGSRWDNNYLMFQCTYMPEGYSREFREFAQHWHRQHPEHPGGMDLAFRDFLKARRERYWIVVPSLVDHREAKSILDPRRSSKRQSKTFVDPVL